MSTFDRTTTRSTQRHAGRRRQAPREDAVDGASARRAQADPDDPRGTSPQQEAGLLAHPGLLPPPVPARHVPRPRLVRRLQESGEATTILLIAPAGYGKSSLLSEWAQSDPRPFAWLGLSPLEGDPASLLARLIDALQRLQGRPDARAAAGRLRRSGGADERSLGHAIELAGSVDHTRGGAVVVLDDAQNVHRRESLQLLGDLARALPEHVKLVLSSRTKPALGLGRLRAAGRLLQLGTGDLAMTAYEAQRLLVAAGLDVDEASLERLVDRTEGWAAGLYLAAVSLRSRALAPGQPQELVGDEHEIAEYVVDEVLAPLPGALRDFLIRTAVLEQLSAGVCDAVLACDGSGLRLRQLAARSPMLVPEDRSHHTYRCHRLLRGVLLGELEVREPAAIAELHLRASEWFAAHGELDRAIDHAVAADAPERAGELLWGHLDQGGRSSQQRVDRWMGAFSEEQLGSSPALSLSAAHHSFDRGDLRAAERWARAASAALDGRGGEPEAAALRAGVGLIEAAATLGGVTEMGSRAATARELLDEASCLRALACLLQGVSRQLQRDDAAAREALEEARRAAGRLPLLEAQALTQLALLDIECAEWEQAGDRLARARATLAADALERHPTVAMTHAASALVLSRAGFADEAKRELAAAARLLEQLGRYMPWYEAQTRVLMARACVRLADVTRARALLSQASRWARRMPHVERLTAAMDEAWGEVDEVGAAALSGPGSLTMAELRVLRFLPTHLSFREIGERLHVSGNTVKSQAHAVYSKLGAASRTEAVAHAKELGLIDVSVI
jgi:LuxR family maltose regulon positive regulatory protein